MIVNFQLFEKLGINEDIQIISDFIFVELKKMKKLDIEKNKIIFWKFPDNKSNIKKLEVIINEKKLYSYFNSKSSYKNPKNNGYYLYIVLNKIDKGDIYHEITHAIQFTKNNQYDSFQSHVRGYTNDIFLFEKKDKKIVDYFLNLFYYTNKDELKSLNSEFLSIFNKFKKRFKDETDIKTVTNLSLDFGKECKNFDIFEHFKNMNEETKRVFFSEVKRCEKWKIPYNWKKKDAPLLNDNDLKLVMTKYQKMINRTGEIFIKNLGKMYSYFTNF